MGRAFSYPFANPFHTHLNGFFHHLGEVLAHESVAIATVVTARGSTPRVAGARQFWTLSGQSQGTIGGGIVEARVFELAQATLKDGKWRVYEADMRGKSDDTRDGVCGGIMTIWIVRLDAVNSLVPVHALEEFLRAGKKALLFLKPEKTAPFGLADSDESCGLSEKCFTESIEPPPRLLIVGAGHIGRSLAHLVDRLGFMITVQDDRPEWLTPNAFPVDSILEKDLKKADKILRHWDGGRFVTLVTRGFGSDVDAFKILGDIPDLDYLGVLGSKARLRTVFNACERFHIKAIGSPALHAPIGMEIGAETPDEIAVSIAAEIIQVWRHGRGSTSRSIQ